VTSDTLVLQSHSWRVLRGWIGRCVDSVRAWSEANGHDYRFLGDEIFDVLPTDYRRKLMGRLPIQADLARLILIRIALNEGGYRRAVWFDADTLIFNPTALSVDIGEETCAFGREIWIAPDKTGKPKAWRNVHNAVCVFGKGDPVLPFLIATTQRIIARADPDKIAPQMVGPKLLSALDGPYGFQLLDTVGAFSPEVLADIADGDGPFLAKLRAETRRLGLRPPVAANLCASLAADDENDAVRDAAIERLVAGRGLPEPSP
jgi:hypothetical protein